MGFIVESFLMCLFVFWCRDLLYKPIVLGKMLLLQVCLIKSVFFWKMLLFNWFLIFSFVAACGHISCFWCVHYSMDGTHESHCPICRNPYSHFPTICQMLHFMLLKMYPVAYKRREKQTLGEVHILSQVLKWAHTYRHHVCMWNVLWKGALVRLLSFI